MIETGPLMIAGYKSEGRTTTEVSGKLGAREPARRFYSKNFLAFQRTPKDFFFFEG